MKARDLAKLLLQHPEMDVVVLTPSFEHSTIKKIYKANIEVNGSKVDCVLLTPIPNTHPDFCKMFNAEEINEDNNL